jgi:hypothetical protein
MQSPYTAELDLFDHVMLRIVIPRVCVKVVLAPRGATISSLKSLLPNPDATLIFNGILLSDENTVEFYQLHTNDSLVAIPSASDPPITNHWMMTTRDADAFADSVNGILNPDLRKEMARLRDRAMIRCELRRRAFRRLIGQKTLRWQCIPSTYPTTIPDPPSELSNSPLPTLS